MRSDHTNTVGPYAYTRMVFYELDRMGMKTICVCLRLGYFIIPHSYSEQREDYNKDGVKPKIVKYKEINENKIKTETIRT